MNIDHGAINYGIVFAYIVGIIILFLLARMMLGPMKIVLKLVLNAFIGGVALLFINLIAGIFSFHIAFNAFTAFIVGFLGIPGFVLLTVLKYIFNA